MSATNLFFHYVSDGAPTRRLTVSVADLEAAIRRQLAAGRRAITLLEYVDGEPDDTCFTVSFDDAHVSVLEHAGPLLARLDVPATLFVPTAYVGTSEEVLGWSQLRGLRDAGWTLGSHSETHPRMGWRLYDEDDAAYRSRLEGECSRSRSAMQRELGVAPRLFAYPYGEAPDAAREAVLKSGYEAAFTVGEQPWTGDLFRIPRVDSEPTSHIGHVETDRPTRFSVVVPAFERVQILSEVVTRLASQSYPEDRYEVIVVDDGSEEDLSPIFDEMPDNVRCVRQGDSSFRAGQARQRGAAEAKFEVLSFLDADVVVDEDFLWHLDWVHRRVPDTVLLGYLSGYNLHDQGHVHTLSDVRGACLDELAVIPDRSREPALRACFDHLEWLADPWTLTYTGNVSLPRALLERVGGFADDFVGWGLEDIDLGYRLHRAGAAFLFSRFAMGWHISDLDEPAPRNPFRHENPRPELFGAYLQNLERLEARHASDATTASFVARSRADVEEICSRPHTVGIEFGGAASVRAAFHHRLNQLAPGGVPLYELLDRVAYAARVQARSVYLLGGAPAEHPDFLELVRRADEVVEWVAMRSPVYAFAAADLADRARDAGLIAVTCEVHAMVAEAHERLFGTGTFTAFREGLERLAEAGISRSARVVISPATEPMFAATLEALAAAEIRVDEVVALDASLATRAAELSPVTIEVLGC